MAIKTSQADTATIAALNHLLRGELSASETYALAIKQLGTDPTGTLKENLDSHNRRVMELRERILDAGGTPDKTSGVWGRFAKLVEQGAAMAGAKSIYAALEEGEDHGLKEYVDYHSDSALTDEYVRTSLLPAQQRSHERMRLLKHST